jgi:hypothetical protein
MADEPREVLSYRRSPVVGQIVPEAEALIDRGAGPGDIRCFFASPRDAVIYFCHAIARRADVSHVNGYCPACGAGGCDMVLELLWTVELHPRSNFAFVQDCPRGTFITYHSICSACFHSLQRETLAAQRRRIALLLAGLAALMGIMFLRARHVVSDRLETVGVWAVLAYFALVILDITSFSAPRRRWNMQRTFLRRDAGGVLFTGLGDSFSIEDARVISAEQVRFIEAAPVYPPVADRSASHYPKAHDDSTAP